MERLSKAGSIRRVSGLCRALAIHAEATRIHHADWAFCVWYPDWVTDRKRHQSLATSAASCMSSELSDPASLCEKTYSSYCVCVFCWIYNLFLDNHWFWWTLLQSVGRQSGSGHRWPGGKTGAVSSLKLGSRLRRVYIVAHFGSVSRCEVELNENKLWGRAVVGLGLAMHIIYVHARPYSCLPPPTNKHASDGCRNFKLVWALQLILGRIITWSGGVH
jgi:hypothetical protein